MGRSRVGLTTKIHALVDGDGLPVILSSHQILLADRAYDSDALLSALAEKGAWANIKPMPHGKR